MKVKGYNFKFKFKTFKFKIYLYEYFIINKVEAQLMFLINWRTTASCFSKPQRS
jgi:hypothetical protein